jgi:tetratricopeptide (TPR) repeat protein
MVTVVMPPAGAVAADQPPPPSHQAVLAYNAGAEAQIAGDFETAAEKFRRAVELDPNLAIAHTGLAGISFIQERWLDAVAEAEKALEIDPADQRALQLRYEAYMKAGETTKAAEAAQALAGSVASADVAGRAYNDAIDAYQAGDIEKARHMLEEAVVVSPDLVKARVFLAAIYGEQGDFDRAAAEVVSALEVEPTDPLALRLGFEIAGARGDWETEIAMAEKLVDVDPEYSGTEFLTRSIELYDGNRFSEAAALSKLVLVARPDDAKAHFICGMAAFNSGDADTARVHLERCVELAPDDPDAAIARELLSYSQ